MIPCTDQGTLQYSNILPTTGPLDQGLDPKHLLRMRIEWWILKKGAKHDMVKCDLTIIGFYTLQSQNTSFRILQIQNLQKHNRNTFYSTKQREVSSAEYKLQAGFCRVNLYGNTTTTPSTDVSEAERSLQDGHYLSDSHWILSSAEYTHHHLC